MRSEKPGSGQLIVSRALDQAATEHSFLFVLMSVEGSGTASYTSSVNANIWAELGSPSLGLEEVLVPLVLFCKF